VSSDPRGDRRERRGSSSNDEGFGHSDGSPRPSTRSLALVAKSEDICDISLFFAREKQENSCPEAHEISVFAVLDKDAKVDEFLKEKLLSYGMEEGGRSITFSIFPGQEYTPILGEFSREIPTMMWEQSNTFCTFSYSLLNQRRGFMNLEKIPPPLMLYCDRRKYFMMKLLFNAGTEKSPGDPIYHHGANIHPITCQKYKDECGPKKNTSLKSQTTQTDSATHDESVSREKSSHHANLKIEEEQPGPSKPVPVKSDMDAKFPRKRRKMDELKESFNCQFCGQILTRQQTLSDHIKRFHTQQGVIGKSKGKGKKSFVPNSAITGNVQTGLQMHDNTEIILLDPQVTDKPNTSISETNTTVQSTSGMISNPANETSQNSQPGHHLTYVSGLPMQQLQDQYLQQQQPCTYNTSSVIVPVSVQTPLQYLNRSPASFTNIIPTVAEQNITEVTMPPQTQTCFQDLIDMLDLGQHQGTTSITSPLLHPEEPN